LQASERGAAWEGIILLFLTDFEGFLTPNAPVDFVVFGQVCSPGHSFMAGNIYKRGQNRDCVGGGANG
jgi:hypothetical protein